MLAPPHGVRLADQEAQLRVDVLGRVEAELMPEGARDRKLEERYIAIMGKSGAAPEIIPGGPDGAIGEATKA